MATSLDKFTVRVSALGNEIYLCRMGKDPHVALDRRPFEAEVMAAVVENMMRDSPKGSLKEVGFGDKRFEISVRPIGGTKL